MNLGPSAQALGTADPLEALALHRAIVTMIATEHGDADLFAVLQATIAIVGDVCERLIVAVPTGVQREFNRTQLQGYVELLRGVVDRAGVA